MNDLQTTLGEKIVLLKKQHGLSWDRVGIRFSEKRLPTKRY